MVEASLKKDIKMTKCIAEPTASIDFLFINYWSD